MKIFVVLYGLFAIGYGTVVAETTYWTLSGHCCGMVWPGHWRNDCMPVQDRYWLTKELSPGTYCDGNWQRRALR